MSESVYQSIFYNPTSAKVFPRLYGKVNLATSIHFDQDNLDTVVLENMKDGTAISTAQGGLTTAPITGRPDQRFKLLQRGEGYSFYSPQTRNCLEALPGEKLKLVPPSNKDSQYWYLDMVEGTVARLRNVSSP